MMPQFAQITPTLNSLSTPKENVGNLEIELDSELPKKINLKCKNIIIEYEQMHNLDVCIYFIPYYFIINIVVTNRI